MSDRNKLVSTKTINTRKRKTVQSTIENQKNKRPERITKKPDRLGKRLSAINRDSFFENALNESKLYNTNEPESIESTVNDTIGSQSTESDILHNSTLSENTDSIELHSTDDEHISVGSNERPQSSFETILSKMDEILIRILAIEKFQAKFFFFFSLSEKCVVHVRSFPSICKV